MSARPRKPWHPNLKKKLDGTVVRRSGGNLMTTTNPPSDGVAPWTKGPWPLKPTGDGKRILVGDGLVEGPNGYEVAEVYSDDCPRELAWANAHLIAAAPDLYAALDRLCVDGALTGLDQQAGWDVFFAQGRAALAKARSPS